MQRSHRSVVNLVSYLDVSEYIIKEPSPLLRPSPVCHHDPEVTPFRLHRLPRIYGFTAAGASKAEGCVRSVVFVGLLDVISDPGSLR